MRKHFFPLFLLCMVMVGFTACKKVNNVTATTQGINNLQEFDQIISEINTDASNLRTGNPQTITKIHLSDAAIQEMRKNIVFDEKGNFRGFTKNGLMYKELSNDEVAFFYEKLSGNGVILTGADQKILSKSPKINNSNYKYAEIWCKDYTVNGCACIYSFDATCRCLCC